MIKQAEALIPTQHGSFRMIAYSDLSDDQTPHIAIVHPEADFKNPVFVRIHSECMTGDVFHSLRCDCGAQLAAALDKVNQFRGVVLYLRQEGRGIGIINKLKAYNLQDEGMDTAEANTHLGFEADARSYEAAIEMLVDMGIQQINLMTNNPDKVDAFNNSGIEVVERIPLIIPPGSENIRYYETKRDVFGHALDW
jgi:GTP cyclohydrolase II